MGVGTGMPLDQLHCPTCGLQILDFMLYVENAEEISLSIRSRHQAEGMRRYWPARTVTGGLSASRSGSPLASLGGCVLAGLCWGVRHGFDQG